MILNSHYRDMLLALSVANVKFMVVGAYALGVHGFPRGTGDIDIWVLPSPENADALLRALKAFGAPLAELSSEDFHHDDTVYQIGVPPSRIDIVTGITALEFEPAYERAIETNLDGVRVRVPCIDDLIINKRATGRTKDLADAERLEGRLDSPDE